MSPARLARIRAELTPGPDPTCRLCGKPMVVGAADQGGVFWNCPGGDWRGGKWAPFDDAPDRTLADRHYSQSEVFRSHPPKMAAELLAEVDRLTTERDDLRAQLAEAEAALANERGEGEPPVPGWAFRVTRDLQGVWETAQNGGMVQRTTARGWYWTDYDTGFSPKNVHPTARDAIKAANAAGKG